jgi:uncharacterized membrane protein YoaK (UPF0700 family)
LDITSARLTLNTAGPKQHDMVHRDVRLALAALSLATGSLDVTAFLRLGGVFASVMTSNLLFVGIAAVKAEGSLAKRCAVVLISYIVGVGIGSRVAQPSGQVSRLGTRRLDLLLGGELALLLIYACLWMAAGAHPKGWDQMVLLAAIAIAMGAQTAAARQLGDPEASTTYLTGTLSGVVSSLAGRHRPDLGAMVALVALFLGAAAGAGLIEVVPMAVPFLAVAAVGATVALSLHQGRSRRPLSSNASRSAGGPPA